MRKFLCFAVLAAAACGQAPQKKVETPATPVPTVPVAQQQETSAPALEEIPTVTPGQAWMEVPCNTLSLPENTFTDLTCYQSQAEVVSCFEKGLIFFWRKKDGTQSYKFNQWGSSATKYTAAAPNRPLTEYYYAYGKFTRAAEYDYARNVVTRLYFDPHQIRITQTNTSGRVLDKYYLHNNGKYIHYPDGNDMAEITGTWAKDDQNRITLDGKFLYTLPSPGLAPDNNCPAVLSQNRP